MSKIGQAPITIPEKTEVTLQGSTILVKGDKGEMSWPIPRGIKVEQADGVLTITRESDTKEHRSLHGLARAVIANLVRGVSAGFEKILEVSGVGFRAEVGDKDITLHVGYSHPVVLPIIEGVEIKTAKNEIIISGTDKELVGEMAGRIRSIKPPEPYKGKGIKYKDEIVRRKAGKAAKTAGA